MFADVRLVSTHLMILDKILIRLSEGRRVAYAVVVICVVLFLVSRSAKWYSCPLVYCFGVLISQLLRSGVESGLLSWFFARDGPQIWVVVLQGVETNPSNIHFVPTDIRFYLASRYHANSLRMFTVRRY